MANPGYTRRQELVCTLDELNAYASVILYEKEVLYVRQTDGSYDIKIGDGVTPVGELPYVIRYSEIKNLKLAAENAKTLAVEAKNRAQDIVNSIKIVQTSGNGDRAIMSQIAVTDECCRLFDDFSSPVATGTYIRVDSYRSKRVMVSADEPVLITHTGKNMLNQPYTSHKLYGSPYVSSGIRYTKREDGSLSVVGTATGKSIYYFAGEEPANRKPIKKGVYTFSGCPAGGADGVYFNRIGITGVGEYYDKGNGVTVTVPEDTTYYAYFTVYAGTTVSFELKPQLELCDHKTEWEPQKEETIELIKGKRITQTFEGINHFIADKPFTLKQSNSASEYVLDIKDFGAVGDGVTDDTDAINLALTQAANKILYIPEGTYLFSGTLHVHSGTQIIGCGERSVFQLADEFTLDSIDWRPDSTYNAKYKYPMILLDEDSNGCVLSNFTLIGSTTTWKDENEDGITVRGSNHILENLLVHNINYSNEGFGERQCLCPAWGIHIFNASHVAVRNCHVYDCGYENIGTEKAEVVTISDCRFGDACQCSAQVHRLSKHIKFYGNTVYQTENIRSTDCAAFTMDASVGVDLDDIIVANNTFGSHVNTVAGGENNIKIIGNHIDGIIYTNTTERYGKGLMICDNYIDGRINARADDVMVANNILNNPAGNHMIRIYGNNVLINNNLGVGSGKETITVGH